MRERWEGAKADHLTPEHQERMIVAWARLRLIDQYARAFAEQKRTVNTSHNQHRWEAMTAASPTSTPHDRTGNPGDVIDRAQLAQSKRLSNMERGEIEALIDRLPTVQRTIVKLLLYEGLTQQDAARRLAVTQPAINAGYQRAQDALREMLSEYSDYVV